MDYTNLYKIKADFSHIKYPIVCLCGSTKFKEEFMEINRIFTKLGFIVVMPGVFGHSGDIITEEEKIKLDELHKQKIKIADLVYIVDKNGYIGNSTKNEIEFSTKLNKTIRYYSEGVEA